MQSPEETQFHARRTSFVLGTMIASLLVGLSLACSSGGSPGGSSNTGGRTSSGGRSGSGGSGGGSSSGGSGGSSSGGSGGAATAGSGGTGGSGSGGSGGSATGGGASTGGAGGGPDNGPGATDRWGNVRFDGGGFVDGIVASPKVSGLFYARTDVGGLYRWNNDQKVWLPLLDWLSQDDLGLFGVESIAVDPSTPGRLFVVAGTSYLSQGKTAVLRSDDYGATFQVVDVSSQWRAHGNGLGRQSGEKLAVDPQNPNIVFCGSRAAGLFKSTDAGKTWANVSSIGVKAGADLTATNGISFVLFDPSSSLTAGGGTSVIYMGVFDATNALYASKDGGATFTPIAGGPAGQTPNRAALGNGNLFLTYVNASGPHNITAGSFYRYAVAAGTWTNLTPKTDDGSAPLGNGGQNNAFGFGGVSVDRADANHIVISTLNSYGGQTRFSDGGQGYGDRIYVTKDGGTTWTTAFSYKDPQMAANANASANGNAWISGGNAIHWAGDVAMNPANGQEAWVVSGNGIFHTTNLGDAAPVWSFESKGIEETVPLDIVSVPGGPLVTAIGDYDGATYQDITKGYPLHKPAIGTTESLGFAPLTGAFLRAGHVTDYSTGSGVESDVMYFTTDLAMPWTKLPTPKGPKGLVALSADGQVLLHRPDSSVMVYRSADQGKTWTTVTGLDAQAQQARIVGDPVKADVFYVLNQQGKLLASKDKGVSFAMVGALQDDAKGLGQASTGLIRTVPGKAGHLWAPLDQAQSSAANGRTTNGLASSEDGGVTWNRFAAVTSAQAVGIGKAADGASYETLFIWGVAGGASNPVGIYYSTDKGATWKRMNDDKHQYGGPGNGAFVQGDMNVFGRVYMSTVGRGLVYGNI